MFASLSKINPRYLCSLTKAHYSAKLAPLQKIIMMCGAPGAGKGTYSRMLAQDFGYVQISTGDEIRKVLNGQSSTLSQRALGKLKNSVEAGRLAPDEIIMEILYNKINEPDSKKGVILDGFPRTLTQLNMFRKVFPIHLAINLEQNYDYLMASILGRRTCMCCGMSYSAFAFYKDGYQLDVQMPAEHDKCDSCKGPVRVRPDDNEQVVKARIEEYNSKTYPLLQHLQKDGLVVKFDGKRGVRDYPKLQQIIVSQIGLPCYYSNILQAASPEILPNQY